MFTGLVEELGKIKAVVKQNKSLHLTITACRVLADLKIGDSIAVNGACLTVTRLAVDGFAADIMPESSARTVFAGMKAGQAVNLERALRAGDRLGGHMVSGHIDGVGVVSKKLRNEIAVLIEVTAPPDIMRYIVSKGSVAVDGVSLTVARYTNSGFTVSLIPHTAAMTTLGIKQAGDQVHIETDMAGKYLDKFLRDGGSPGITLALLRDNGFM